MQSKSRAGQTGASAACSGASCRCAPSAGGIARREFLKWSGVAALSASLTKWHPIAGPFTLADFEQLVPADKRLDPAWVRSLFDRGEPQVWRGAELKHIGMPIGGITCGQLYLGGDGRLWYWQIFKPNYSTDYAAVTSGVHYAKPLEPFAPLDQGFAVMISAEGKKIIRGLDSQGFADVSFRGEYPMAKIQFRDPSLPVLAELEAFSPFIPLDPDSSAFPATVLQYTFKNTSSSKIEVEVAGWLQNAVCLFDDQPAFGIHRNRISRRDRALVLECSAEPPPSRGRSENRPDLLFENFEQADYRGWTSTGTAFGSGPVEKSTMPSYQGDVGAQGQRLVNSHNVREGGDVAKGDAQTGTLISRPFVIERDFITFLIGGGNHPRKTCLNLLVEGEIVASATGHNDNRMRRECFDATTWAGKAAQLQIVDDVAGAWGNIGVDEIVFTDRVPNNKRWERLPAQGNLSLSLLRTRRGDAGVAVVGTPFTTAALFAALHEKNPVPSVTMRFGEKLIGAVGRRIPLQPNESATATFVLTWYFPAYSNSDRGNGRDPGFGETAAALRQAVRFGCGGRFPCDPAFRFAHGADAVMEPNLVRLDFALLFLDRTFVTIDTLATTTCHWFDTGRFYGWEESIVALEPVSTSGTMPKRWLASFRNSSGTCASGLISAWPGGTAVRWIIGRRMAGSWRTTDSPARSCVSTESIRRRLIAASCAAFGRESRNRSSIS
ncbi:MAG: GH116 family glycosyl-hydrolase [Verrucomicrobiota bacterium]